MKTILTLTLVLFCCSYLHAQSSSKQESKLSESDRLQIAVQKICPVMGAELGSMGDPIKVKIGEQIAWLCCDGCKSKKVDGEHWKTVQANIAAAQGVCPIMGKEVDASMESTIVNGQIVFVCCPPCIPKIEADVEGSMKKVHASYAAFVAKERQAKSDQLHIAAQQICPVSGQDLSAVDNPIKIKVGEEEHAFLCCKGCQNKEINAEHWKTIQANLAKAQGTCPVMGKEVDASMESVVVNGRKIFVCCPPCIDKIKENSDEYLAKLDKQIEANVEK